MKYLLHPHYEGVLVACLSAGSLIAFDFDGTLAPIRASRSAVSMRRRTRALLGELARLSSVCIISGRRRADVTRLTRPLKRAVVFGNHGAEPHPRMREWARWAARWRAALEPEIERLDGVELEDKGVSLAIHYRAAPSRAAARRAIQRRLARLDGPLRIVGGKAVLNLVHARAPTKADALRAHMRTVGAHRALYVGDDHNDEDVFAAGADGSITTVRVGRSGHSAATYYLCRQLEIDELLARLVRLARSMPVAVMPRARPHVSQLRNTVATKKSP